MKPLTESETLPQDVMLAKMMFSNVASDAINRMAEAIAEKIRLQGNPGVRDAEVSYALWAWIDATRKRG